MDFFIFPSVFLFFKGVKKEMLVDLESLEYIVNDFIVNICIQEDIDIKDIKPIKWLYIINRLHRDVIKPNVNVLLKVENNKNNQYDINKVLYMYEIYKDISLKYMQEITLKCFCDLSGIEKQSIYNWGGEASSKGFDLHEKILADNEQSLEQLLKDKSINPMKILPILNRKHNWNLPGVREQKKQDGLIGRENITLAQPEIVPQLPTSDS